MQKERHAYVISHMISNKKEISQKFSIHNWTNIIRYIYIFHHSTSLCCESKVIICKIIQLIPQLILCRPIELILFYFSQNESLVFYPNLRLSFSKIIQCRSSSRQVSPFLSIDIRFGIILFFAIPITANDFSNSTVVAPGSLKITYFPRLSWSSLEFPRIEEPIRFSSSHSTLPLDPLHPLKTERNGEWPFSGKVSKLRPDIAFNLGYWNCEISINSFELREREREKDSKYIWKNRIPFIRENNGWINIDLIYRIIQRVFVCNTKSKWRSKLSR